MGYVDGQTVIREHYHNDAAPKYLLVQYAQFGKESDVLLRRELDCRKHRAIHNVWVVPSSNLLGD